MVDEPIIHSCYYYRTRRSHNDSGWSYRFVHICTHLYRCWNISPCPPLEYRLGERLTNNTSTFYRWYTKTVIDETRYDKLKSALYFDRDIDTIYQNLDSLINQFTPIPIPGSHLETVWHVSVKTQTGGTKLRTIVGTTKKFIVGTISYLIMHLS